MKRTIALLITLDTKDQEAGYLIDQIESRGMSAMLLDIGVVGTPGIEATFSREEVARAGGTELKDLLAKPTREEAGPIMVKGAISILKEKL